MAGSDTTNTSSTRGRTGSGSSRLLLFFLLPSFSADELLDGGYCSSSDARQTLAFQIWTAFV